MLRDVVDVDVGRMDAGFSGVRLGSDRFWCSCSVRSDPRELQLHGDDGDTFAGSSGPLSQSLQDVRRAQQLPGGEVNGVPRCPCLDRGRCLPVARTADWLSKLTVTRVDSEDRDSVGVGLLLLVPQA